VRRLHRQRVHSKDCSLHQSGNDSARLLPRHDFGQSRARDDHRRRDWSIRTEGLVTQRLALRVVDALGALSRRWGVPLRLGDEAEAETTLGQLWLSTGRDFLGRMFLIVLLELFLQSVPVESLDFLWYRRSYHRSFDESEADAKVLQFRLLEGRLDRLGFCASAPLDQRLLVLLQHLFQLWHSQLLPGSSIIWTLGQAPMDR
jgi:hypothetical protein